MAADDRPPGAGPGPAWGALYLAVIGALLVQIVLYALLTWTFGH